MKTITRLSGKYTLFLVIKQRIVEKTKVKRETRKVIKIVLKMIFFLFLCSKF